MLCEDISRNFKGTRGHTEPLYEYLNRSARPSMERVRDLLEGWFSYLPSDAKNEIRSRFRSSDDIQHQSAFFEIYLHALFSKLGFQIEIHPEIPGQTTHPEFLVSKEEKPVSYIEATLASGPKEDKAADKRESVVYETIDKTNSPNFFIGIKVSGSPNTPPPGRKWRTFLEKWLSELDPDTLGEKIESYGLEGLPTATRDHDGWTITFQAIPKSPKARGKPGIRPIGVRFFGFEQLKEDEYIRNAVKEKATKYGNLDFPYVIAINVLSIFCRDQIVMDALFGDEGIRFYNKPGGGSYHKPIRNPNGAFCGPSGPQNTRVSGVIICKNLLWGNISSENPVLWHNPWASLPLDQDSWIFPQYVPNFEKTRIELKSGRKVRDLFGLPEGWPIKKNEKDLG